MTPEYNLWVECLTRWIDDALSGVPEPKGKAETEATRAYLTTPSPDLTLICQLVGFEPDAFVTAMRKRIAEAPTIDELFSTPRKYANTNSRPTLKPRLDKHLHRTNSRRLTYDGQTLTIDQWADRTGLSTQTIYYRLRQGWSVERTLAQPLRRKRKKAGVVPNFKGFSGTGGGTAGQDSTDITFLGSSK